MKIKTIGYRLTTTDQFKCHKCGASIDGKEGYLNIQAEEIKKQYFAGNKVNIFRICWDCSANMISEIYARRKTRKEDYTKLIKQKILTKLR